MAKCLASTRAILFIHRPTKGLEVAVGEPLYVTDIQPSTILLFLAVDELKRHEMMVRDINLIKYDSLEGVTKEAVTRIRYKDKGTLSSLEQVVLK